MGDKGAPEGPGPPDLQQMDQDDNLMTATGNDTNNKISEPTNNLVNSENTLTNNLSNKNQTNSASRSDLTLTIQINKYSKTDPGPYFVFVEKNDNKKEKIHPMKVGRLIHKDLPRYNQFIKNISIVNRNKIKIEFTSYDTANKIISEKILIENSYSAYIPKYFTTKSGIIKNIPTDTTKEEIFKDILTPFPISDIFRFNKRGDKNTPLETVKITFVSQTLPEYIYLHGVRVRVIPFIPATIQCKKCLMYHHKQENCRREQHKCPSCLDSHPIESCLSTAEPVCFFCKGNHLATNHELCPEFTKQKKIKEIMTLHNLTYREASSNFSYKTYANRADNPSLINDTYNFPILKQANLSQAEKRKKIDSDSETEKSTSQKKNFTISVPSRQKARPIPSKSNFPQLPQTIQLNPTPITFNPYTQGNNTFSQNNNNNFNLNNLTEIIYEIIETVKNKPYLEKESLQKLIETNLTNKFI